VLGVTKHRHIAEIQIKSGHLVLSSTEETEDLYASIREVVNHLERQLHRHKEKIQDHKHKRGPRDPEVAATIEANVAEEAAQQEEAAGES
jgi:putative sigma-54 modulation protein